MVTFETDLLTDASPPPALRESAGGLATDPAGWERQVTGFLAPRFADSRLLEGRGSSHITGLCVSALTT